MGCFPLSDASSSVQLRLRCGISTELCEVLNLCEGYDSKDLIENSVFDSAGEETNSDSDDTSGDSITDFSIPIDTEKDSTEDEPHLATVHSSHTRLSTPEEVGTTVSLLLEGRFDDISKRSLGDIAIVVRKNRHLEAIAAELDNRQIPYTIDGGSAGSTALEPGLQTVVSYLKSLVKPKEDIHLYRVLMLLYRIPDEDLQQLVNTSKDSLVESLIKYEDISGASFTHTKKIARARDDYMKLKKLSETQSLPHFYQIFLEETQIEWFIQERSQERLSDIQQFIGRVSKSSRVE